MPDSRFSVLLADARRGDSRAHGELIEFLYQDLRRLAQSHLKHERRSPLLQAMVLVN